MKKSEMIKIVLESRNTIGFLTLQQTLDIQCILNTESKIDKLSFVELSTLILRKYHNKQISNKRATQCFKILKQSSEGV